MKHGSGCAHDDKPFSKDCGERACYIGAIHRHEGTRIVFQDAKVQEEWDVLDNPHDDKPLLIPVPFDPVYVPHDDTTEPMKIKLIIKKAMSAPGNSTGTVNDFALTEAIAAINALIEQRERAARVDEVERCIENGAYLSGTGG